MAIGTLPYTPSKLSDTVAENKSGTTHRGGQAFFTRGLSDRTLTTVTAHTCREEELLFARAIDFAMQLAVEWIGGLNVGVAPGYYRKAEGAAVEFAGAASFTLADDTADQKIWIAVATNALAKGASWPADLTTFVPLAIATTAAGVLTSLADARELLRCWIPASSSAPTGTSATAFTLDDENAGVEVDMDIRFNAGSTDAEDRALRWVAAALLFRLLAQHTTGTRAGLDVAKLQVAGADVIDTLGDLAAAAIKATTLYEFGPNGATPAGLRIVPAAGTGPPAAGTHAAGEEHTDAAGIKYVCIAAGSPGTWMQAGKQNSVIYPSIGDGSASAGNPATCSIRIKDGAGQNLARTCKLTVKLMDDVDGAADAPNCSAFTVITGSLLRTLVANKQFVVKTNASGLVTFTVVNSIADQVFVLTDEAPGEAPIDKSDTGQLTWT